MHDAHKAAGELEAIAKELLGKIEQSNAAVDESAADWPVLSPFEIQQFRQRIAEACQGDAALESGRDVTAQFGPVFEDIVQRAHENFQRKHVRLWPAK